MLQFLAYAYKQSGYQKTKIRIISFQVISNHVYPPNTIKYITSFPGHFSYI